MRAWCSRSRSGTTSPPRARSTTPSAQVFAEEQIYRIDHYLGKETVQNLMVAALRQRAVRAAVERRATSTTCRSPSPRRIGVEGRGGYYDQSGALRDMVQNHLLQLLCLIAMEPPTAIDADAVRDEKLKVLQALRPITRDRSSTLTPCAASTRRGRSTASRVPAISTELGQPDQRHRDLRRAAGRDRQLALGGRAVLPAHRQAPAEPHVRDHRDFKQSPHSIFPHGDGQIAPNRLIIRLQPDEGITHADDDKDPGPGASCCATCR